MVEIITGVSAVPRAMFFSRLLFQGWVFLLLSAFYPYLKAWVADQDFTTLGSVQTWWGKKDSVLQIGVFWDMAMKFFHCFCSCRETHIWTGISKSKCQGLSNFCTGVSCRLCHVILCCNLWALDLAWSLGYLSNSAPLYAPCFLLVWLHFILDSLPTKGTSSRETSAHPVSWGFSFFPCPCFCVFNLSLCGEEGPCSSLWGSGSHGWREQQCSHAGSTTHYSHAFVGIPSKALARAPGKGWMPFSWSPCAHPHCSLQGKIPDHWRITSSCLCLMWTHKPLSVYNMK